MSFSVEAFATDDSLFTDVYRYCNSVQKTCENNYCKPNGAKDAAFILGHADTIRIHLNELTDALDKAEVEVSAQDAKLQNEFAEAKKVFLKAQEESRSIRHLENNDYEILIYGPKGLIERAENLKKLQKSMTEKINSLEASIKQSGNKQAQVQLALSKVSETRRMFENYRDEFQLATELLNSSAGLVIISRSYFDSAPQTSIAIKPTTKEHKTGALIDKLIGYGAIEYIEFQTPKSARPSIIKVESGYLVVNEGQPFLKNKIRDPQGNQVLAVNTIPFNRFSFEQTSARIQINEVEKVVVKLTGKKM